MIEYQQVFMEFTNSFTPVVVGSAMLVLGG